MRSSGKDRSQAGRWLIHSEAVEARGGVGVWWGGGGGGGGSDEGKARRAEAGRAID